MQKFNRDLCDKIIDWFLETSYAKDMENCLNGIDEYHLNPYHQERSILDHALMVSSEAIKHWSDDKDFYILFMAGLVHDIGKVRARSVEMRNSSGEMMCIFRNHENIGLTFAADILLSFIKTDLAIEIEYSWEELKRTLLLVPHHDIYKYTHEEAEVMYRDYTRLIAMFSVCDTRGRIMDEPRNIDEHIKYISNGDTNLGNKIRKHLYNIDFLIGVPSSGKSTYSEIHERNHKYKYIISRDDIIDNLGRYLSHKNREYTETFGYNLSNNVIGHLKDIARRYVSYKSRFEKLTEDNLQKWIDHIFMYRYHMAIMNNDGNILIDKTNLVKKSRKQLLNVFTKSPYGNVNDIKYNLSLFNKRAIIMAEGYNSIIERNIKRELKVGNDIIDKMIMTSNIPNFEEFDDLIVTKIVKLKDYMHVGEGEEGFYEIENIINESSKVKINFNDLSFYDDLHINRNAYLDLDNIFRLVKNNKNMNIRMNGDTININSDLYGCMIFKIEF